MRLKIKNKNKNKLSKEVSFLENFKEKFNSINLRLGNCSNKFMKLFFTSQCGMPAHPHVYFFLFHQISLSFILYYFSDDCIDSSRPGCKLTSVELAGCQQLSSTCIRHLTELCGPSLQNLNVANTGVSFSHIHLSINLLTLRKVIYPIDLWPSW